MTGGYQTKITFNGKKVTLKGFGFDKYKFLLLGKTGRDAVVARAQAGKGSNDLKMPPLKRAYAIRKTKAGHRNFRDLTFTGDMLANLSVRSADENSVKIAFTTLRARQKARGNENKAPWLNFSPRDNALILDKAEQLFQSVVKDAKAQIPYLKVA